MLIQRTFKTEFNAAKINTTIFNPITKELDHRRKHSNFNLLKTVLLVHTETGSIIREQ